MASAARCLRLVLPLVCGILPLADLGPATAAAYRAVSPEGLGFNPPPSEEPAVTLLLDLDGDGGDELAYWSGMGILGTEPRPAGRAVTWQTNLPPAFTAESPPRSHGAGIGPFPMVRLHPAGDLDGDGCEDILLTAVDRDGEDWRLGLVTGRNGELRHFHRLPLGPDTRADGVWEGDWRVLGVLPAGAAGPGVAVVLAATPGYDAGGRQVAAYDLASGTRLWSRPLGPNPQPDHCWVGDLEGDGSPEILVAASSPGNLGERVIGGHSDDRARLLLLDARGAIRWQRVMGKLYCGLQTAVADVLGDPAREIVVATAHARAEDRDALEILAADGTVVARRWLPGPAWGLGVAAGEGADSQVYLATAAGVLARYAVRGGALDRPDEVVYDRPITLLQVRDALPAPGPELLLLDRERRQVVVHGADLQELHRTPVLATAPPKARFWPVDSRTTAILAAGQSMRLWRLEPAPRTLPAAAWLALGTVPVGVGLYGARRWRRHRQPATRAAGAAATARALDPALVIRRDVMRSIFGEVMVSNHGRISLVATLETLAAQLGRCGSSLVRLTDTGPRARRAIEDFLEFDRDALQEILVKATAVHFEPARVDAMRASLARIEEHLHALLDAELAPAVVDRLHPRLGRDVARLEGEFRAFYRELEGHFTCDFADILARVLDRYTDLAQQQRITIVTEPDRTRREPVLVEAAALRLTLDNLVGNAIRAMREGQGHRLHIGWRADRGQLVVRVTDTGCGIGPDRVDDLFSGRASTRPGGGVGLARSRRLLGHTGGVIELERSVPGQGSTFRLRLPRPVIATAQHDQEGATA